MFRHRLFLFSIPSFIAICSLALVTQVSAQELLPPAQQYTACQADVTKDNVVDISDFSLLVKSFLGSDPTIDINKDNVIDVSDISIVISLFLQSCTERATPAPTPLPTSIPQPGMITIKAVEFPYTGSGYYNDTNGRWLAVLAGNPPSIKTAKVTTGFTGVKGTYSIKLYGVGDMAGQSSYQLFVNDVKRGDFLVPLAKVTVAEGELYNVTWPDIALIPGDKISIQSNTATIDKVSYSRGRWSKIEIFQGTARATVAPTSSPIPTATPTPTPDVSRATPTPAPTITPVSQTIQAISFPYSTSGYYSDSNGKYLAVKAGDPPGIKTAKVTTTFSGATATYSITLHGAGEADAQSTYELFVNNVSKGTFLIPLGTSAITEGTAYNKTWSGISLKSGDTISVQSNTATKDNVNYSRGRWSKIVITAQ